MENNNLDFTKVLKDDPSIAKAFQDKLRELQNEGLELKEAVKNAAESLGHKLTDNDWAYFAQGEKKNSEDKEELTDKELDQVAGGKFGDSNWDYVDCLMLCAD